MTNMELLKSMTPKEAGRFLCDAFDYESGLITCAKCPVQSLCEVGGNGWANWLSKQTDAWEAQEHERVAS